jgi:hypothetical protein
MWNRNSFIAGTAMVQLLDSFYKTKDTLKFQQLYEKLHQPKIFTQIICSRAEGMAQEHLPRKLEDLLVQYSLL